MSGPCAPLHRKRYFYQPSFIIEQAKRAYYLFVSIEISDNNNYMLANVPKISSQSVDTNTDT